MSNIGIHRIAKLGKLNGNPNWVNKGLYRLMYKQDLYIIAYERIKSKPGNMTPGVDGSTLDHFSINMIGNIIKQMKTESFQFTTGRRIYIDKKGSNKKRPITIAPPREKIVQEVMRMILESIYDSTKPNCATFLGCSHGFRRGRGTHTALKEIRKWKNVGWFIEGDIKGCFDNVDHEILVKLLRKHIQDERFISLIWKALKAGYMEFNQPPVSTISGTPQGSIVSPILANIYLHELDKFATSLKEITDSGRKRKTNPEYKRISSQLEYWKKKGNKEKTAELAKRKRAIPWADPNDNDYKRMHYIRYADDWIVGVTGPKVLAVDIRDKLKEFLSNELNLTLSLEKTHIRHARSESAFFLGTYIKTESTKNPKISRVEQAGKKFKRRGTGWNLIMKAPIKELINKLSSAGFCNKEGKPNHKTSWINYDPHDILLRYNATLHGILNYYAFVDNFAYLSSIEAILMHSAAKTLASKYRLGTRRKVFKRFGKNLRISTKEFGKERTTEFKKVQNWKRHPNRFLITDAGNTPIEVYWNKYTKSGLFLKCVICRGENDVEMHHLRHIRKSGQRLTGFAKQMALINRKQIPVCIECHELIHLGKYDGIDLRKITRENNFP